MNLFRLLGICALFLGHMAMAEDFFRPSYELSIKPEKDKAVVLPSVGFLNFKSHNNFVSTKEQSNGNRIGVEYLKGYNKDWTIGSRISYLDVGSKSDKTSGLNDVEFVAKSQKDYKNETLLYGVTGYWSFDKSRWTSSNSGFNSNNFSGGPSVEPYVALVKKVNTGKVTMGLAYTKKFERKLVVKAGGQSSLGTIEGGDTSHLFANYDHAYKDNTVGVGASIYSMGKETTNIVDDAFDGSSVSLFKGELYYLGRVSADTQFVPSLQYFEVLNETNFSSTGFQVSLAYLKSL